MNKQQLIDGIMDVLGPNVTAKSSVEKVLDAQAIVATEALKSGDEVTLNGLGKLKTSQRKARNGRNPRTGLAIEIAASRAVGFTAFKQLKEAVNG